MTETLRYRRLWWFLGAVLALAVLSLSLMPDPPEIPGDRNNWTGHLAAYGVMMGWFARLTPSGRRRLAIGAGLCALGIAVEFAQRATGWRTFDTMDMVANAAGVLLGWLASPPRVPHGIAALDRALARRLDPGTGRPA